MRDARLYMRAEEHLRFVFVSQINEVTCIFALHYFHPTPDRQKLRYPEGAFLSRPERKKLVY